MYCIQSKLLGESIVERITTLEDATVSTEASPSEKIISLLHNGYYRYIFSFSGIAIIYKGLGYI
ncbi:MAG TPA: hypothetical protein PK733_03995 [Clostridiales bacterium]|nr:hypothetical protein [Clostridiales bacterium]